MSPGILQTHRRPAGSVMNGTISRRDFLGSVAVATAALTAPAWLRADGTPVRRPNFVFFLVDDMGWRDLACYGSKFYLSPNIDRLAAAGMKFTDAYAPAPNCAPSRASILTGMYTPRHGVLTVGSSERGNVRDRKLIPVPNNATLEPKFVTIAELLHAAGYATAHVGKWHLGSAGKTGPEGQGFDLNVAGDHSGSPSSYFSPYRMKKLKDGPKGEYLTDRLTDEAVGFLERHAKDKPEQPFFLYFPHYAVHVPLQAKDDLKKKYAGRKPDGGQKNATYAAMIDSTDQSVGRVLDALDRLKLAEDTVVILMSDNGGFYGSTSNAPLRGAKGMVWEGGIREPMIVRWPGKVKAGAVCTAPVHGVDFFPTMLELAGAKPDPAQPMDGESIVPLLRQTGELKRDAIFWHLPIYLEGRGGVPGWRLTPCGAIRQGDFKLVEFFEDGRLELYNLREDLSESKDLAAAMPQKVKELHDRLIAWRRNVNAAMPLGPNPRYVPPK